MYKYYTKADLVREFFLVPSLSLSQQGEEKRGLENEVDQSHQALKRQQQNRCTMSNISLQNEHTKRTPTTALICVVRAVRVCQYLNLSF